MKESIHISIIEFCKYNYIKKSFVQDLADNHLIKLLYIEKQPHIHCEELPKLEKMVRLHQDLNVNLEGIDVIQQLLQKMSQLQDEVLMLRRKLDRFDEF
ncbi:chaperone modulator CbpM [Flagellimonas sp. S3867]|uniref:chaperone modulator CbpM n=1 Tax=Flagellimonas sp. S3867 TaxID=2768063 RepID=UPI001687C29D|nr:chaperone modulator CbpM [Flagellimonas sp. S3867]